MKRLILALVLTSGCAANATPEPQASPDRVRKLCAPHLVDAHPLKDPVWTSRFEGDEREEAGEDQLVLVRELGAQVFVAGSSVRSKAELEEKLSCIQRAYRTGAQPRADFDPLAVPEARVQVSQRRAGYLVRIEGQSEQSIDEIVRRALAL